MRSKAFVLAFVAAALVAVLMLPASASAAVSFTQTAYPLETYEPSHGVGSQVGSSNSLFEANTPVAVGDFNGDGKPDIVISDYEAEQIYVLLNDGSGKFSPAPESPYFSGTCLHPDSVLTGDFNGDGKRDALVACGAFSEEIQLFEGDGTGALAPTATHFAGEGPMFVGNLDGDTEIVYDKFIGGTCTLDLERLEEGGDQSENRLCFGAEQEGAPVHWFTSLCGGDEWLSFGGEVLGDRGIELATVEHDKEPLHECDGTATHEPLDSGIPISLIANSLGAADLNGDGVPDIVATDDGQPGAFHVIGVTSSESGLSFAGPPRSRRPKPSRAGAPRTSTGTARPT